MRYLTKPYPGGGGAESKDGRFQAFRAAGNQFVVADGDGEFTPQHRSTLQGCDEVVGLWMAAIRRPKR